VNQQKTYKDAKKITKIKAVYVSYIVVYHFYVLEPKSNQKIIS